MPVTNGVYTPLTLDTALKEVIASAPSSIVFSPGNPPELILANMFAEANVLIDENNGEIIAMMMSPVGSMIDLLNPNNPRKVAIAATGYVVATNSSATAVSIPPATVITASTGQTYTTGETALTVPGNGSLDVPVTCSETGMGGNISSGNTFTFTGLSTLSGTNPLPFLSGTDSETDAAYLNRLTSEKTEYGAQSGSVAVETELKKYYPNAKIYVNNTGTELTTPVPVPANGYNLIVQTPSGTLAQAAEINQIFQTEANRLEFVNSQTTGTTLHKVMSGTIYTTGVPQSYYFTVAQPVKTTMTIVVNIRADSNVDRSELISQANDFAVFFINRLMSMFSGIDGTTNITYEDDEYSNVVTAIDIAGNVGLNGNISPAFGVETIKGLVVDLSSMSSTPQILYDSTASITVVIDPQVAGQSAITMTIGGAKTFIDFENDSLFTDSTSWFDRYMYIDPANIAVTMKVTGWI